MRKIVLTLFLAIVAASFFACGTGSKSAKDGVNPDKAQAEADLAELIRRQQEYEREAQ